MIPIKGDDISKANRRRPFDWKQIGLVSKTTLVNSDKVKDGSGQTKGRMAAPNQMNFRENSKRPFGKLYCKFFYNGYGCIYASRYEGKIV